MDREKVALDVWLKFVSCNDDAGHVANGCDCDDVAEYEANTYRSGDGYVVEWYHTAVGSCVVPRYFETYEAAREWLESEGFQDFSS